MSCSGNIDLFIFSCFMSKDGLTFNLMLVPSEIGSARCEELHVKSTYPVFLEKELL